MATEVINAVVVETYLGNEEHGSLEYNLEFSYGGMGQGTGMKLVTTNGEILHIIQTIVDRGRWEHLKGKSCRVRREDGVVKAIGHYLNDRWYDLSST